MIHSDVYLRGIPQSLRDMSNFVLWRLEDRNGRRAKVPYSLSGRRASSADARMWCDFNAAVAALEADGGEQFNGLGFVFSVDNDIVGVDIDHCFTDGVLVDEAAAILEHFPGTYCEVSQSGEGLHVLCRGHIPRSFRRGAVECYPSKRFFALTANVLQPCDVNVCQSGLDWLWERYGRRDAPPGGTAQPPISHAGGGSSHGGGLTDDEVIEHIKRRDRRGAMLLDGDWQGAGYGSASEADAALCTVLSFWTDRDAGRVERLFSASALGQRRKWTERPDYRQRTIAAGCAACREGLNEWRERRRREEVKRYECAFLGD